MAKKQDTYPSPCETCGKDYGCPGCSAWETRYRYRQKQINAYAQRMTQRPVAKLPGNKFCYDHPDHVRQWLKESPCKGCSTELFCDKPCEIYLRWYNARMEIVRKKVQG